jgi:hypothetical protein
MYPTSHQLFSGSQYVKACSFGEYLPYLLNECILLQGGAPQHRYVWFIYYCISSINMWCLHMCAGSSTDCTHQEVSSCSLPELLVAQNSTPACVRLKMHRYLKDA